MKLQPRLPTRRLSFRDPKLRVHFPRRRSNREWAFWACVVALAALCFFLYFRFVGPSIAGKTEIRIGSDSDHYWEAVDLFRAGHGKELVSLTGNFLGPTLIGALFETGFGVMCFNFGLLALAWKIAEGIPNLNKATFGFLLIANAEIIPSLTTLNKEILTLFTSVLTVRYLASRRRSFFVFTALVAVAIVARWEQAAFLFILLVFEHSPLRKRPWAAIFSLVMLITVAYPFAFRILGVDPATFDDILEGANTIRILDSLQNSFLFPLVVLPKIAMLFLGRLAQPQCYLANSGLASGFQDPQQEIFQPLGCLATFCLFAYAAWTKRLSPCSPVVLLAFITLIATAATPFIQPRYVYGVYILISLEIERIPKPARGICAVRLTRLAPSRQAPEIFPAAASRF